MGGGKEVSDGKMRLVEGLKTRQVAGQTVLLPIGETTRIVKQSVLLNKEAARLVGLMQAGEFTVDDIVSQGLTIYAVEEDVLRKDVEKIVGTLKQARMISDDTTDTRLKPGTHSISRRVYLDKYGNVIKSVSEKKTSPHTGSL